MRRRTFLRTAGGAAAATVAPTLLSGCRPRERDGFRAWAWVHGGRDRTLDQWRPEFARLRTAGIGGVLVSGGDVHTLAPAAHAEGLEFHRWIWTLNRSGDRWVKENHPEWFTVSRRGVSSLEHPPYVGYYQWLCPTRPQVREYLRNVVEEIAALPGVDGVHLDYVRHSDVILPIGLWSKYGLVQDREYPEFDFCYCDVCREQFERQAGYDPLSLADPSRDAAWRSFRWDSVTGLVQVLAEAVRGRDKQISAAVFPTPAIARSLVRQAWDEWSLDAVFPMMYHGFYEEAVAWIGSATSEGRRALPPATHLYSGLYLPSLAPDDLADAIQLARGAGASGVSLFEMDGLSDDHLVRLREAMAEGHVAARLSS